MIQTTGGHTGRGCSSTARKLRICFFARANYELVRRRTECMAQRGHEVHLITLHEGRPKGTHVHALQTNVPGPFRYVWVIPQVRKLVREIAPDVIDVHGVSAYGLWATLPLRRPTVVTVYGPDLSMDAMRSGLLRSLMRKTLRGADLVYGSTATVRDLAHETLGIDLQDRRLAVRSWGIPCQEIGRNAGERRAHARAQFGAGPDDRVVLHARHMTNFWRVRKIFDAIPTVLHSDPRTRFWFVYPEPNAEGRELIAALQARIENLGIADNVRLIGPQKYHDYLTIAHGADVFLCIGRSDLLASTLLESMHVGLVPVLANLPVYAEVIVHGRNGFFVDTFDPAALSAAIAKASNLNARQRAQIAEINRGIVVSRYDTSECTDWLLERYTELVSASSDGTHAAYAE